MCQSKRALLSLLFPCKQLCTHGASSNPAASSVLGCSHLPSKRSAECTCCPMLPRLLASKHTTTSHALLFRGEKKHLTVYQLVSAMARERRDDSWREERQYTWWIPLEGNPPPQNNLWILHPGRNFTQNFHGQQWNLHAIGFQSPSMGSLKATTGQRARATTSKRFAASKLKTCAPLWDAPMTLLSQTVFQPASHVICLTGLG